MSLIEEHKLVLTDTERGTELTIWVDSDEDLLVMKDETGQTVSIDVCHVEGLVKALKEVAEGHFRIRARG